MSWLVTNNGVTQPTDVWGIGKLVLTRKGSFAMDTLTFTAPGREIDLDPLFPKISTLLLVDPTGTQRFVGVVRRVPLKGSTKAEDQMYEVRGPWDYFERLPFQQETVSYDTVSNTLISTLTSMVIVNQQLDGTQIDLGQVVSSVLSYLLLVCAAAPVPFVPFQIGEVTPSTMIPFTQVRDQSCAQVIISMMQWVPDAIGYFDYATTPPTFHVKRRGDLPLVTLAAYRGIVSDIDLTPLDDLVVPAVAVKYRQVFSTGSSTFNTQVVDLFPTTAPDPALDNVVLDLDLQAANSVFQKQSIVVADRPLDYNAYAGTGVLASVTKNWIINKVDWMKFYVQGGGTVQVISPDDFSVMIVQTTLDANTPVTIPPIDPNALKEELISGHIASWMTSDQSVQSATAKISITLQYIGTDPVVRARFDGNSLLTLSFGPLTITNGQTQEYSQMTSFTPPEPRPVGLAQALYEGLSVLHYQGAIEIAEDECSGAVSLGAALNLGGGRAEWATMNAQVHEIVENLDEGITMAHVGPPVQLTGQQRMDMARASVGRIQAENLDQRSTADAGADNAVKGIGQTPQSAVSVAPGSSAASNPYTCSDASAGGTCMIAVTPGMTGGKTATGSPLTVAAGTGTVYYAAAFTYTGAVKTMTSVTLMTTTGAVPASTCSGGGSGTGSGTLNYGIATYTATVTGGKANVSCQPLIGGSHDFGVCMAAITGPWGV